MPVNSKLWRRAGRRLPNEPGQFPGSGDQVWALSGVTTSNRIFDRSLRPEVSDRIATLVRRCVPPTRSSLAAGQHYHRVSKNGEQWGMAASPTLSTKKPGMTPGLVIREIRTSGLEPPRGCPLEPESSVIHEIGAALRLKTILALANLGPAKVSIRKPRLIRATFGHARERRILQFF